MSNQQYCLRWTNHQPNFISTFSSLLTDECLVDVTLAAEGRYLQAHRVVLSACSTYFQKLFSVSPSQHPIVVLKDVAYQDLRSVIDFMYHGEVNVTPQQLRSVLKTAETLNIKGLADMPVTAVFETDSNEKCCESPAVMRRKRFRKSGRSDATAKSPLEEIEILGPSHLNTKTDEYCDIIRHMSSNDSLKNNVHNGCQSSICRTFESSASEENKYIEITSSSLLKPEENTTGISVITGIKRRSRLLIRQPHFVKSEFDFDKNNDSEVRKAVKRPLGRQYSDPTPQQNPSSSATTMSEEKPNFLTVPSSYLQKQNSDSALPCQPENSDPLALQTDLLRETVATSYDPLPRSNHCPMLRPGPALGCNFCWNTVDNRGRILRRKTKYHCPECRTNLCIVPCFQEYHKRKDLDEVENDLPKENAKEESTDSIAHQTHFIQKGNTSSTSPMT